MTASLIFDIIAILITIAMASVACSHGFFREIANKASYIIGLMFALMFSKNLSAFAYGKLETVNPIIISLCSFCLIFIVAALLTRYIGGALAKLMKTLHVGVVDKILGFFLGLIEAFCLITIILILLEKQSFFDLGGIFDNSYYNKYICDNIRTLLKVSG